METNFNQETYEKYQEEHQKKENKFMKILSKPFQWIKNKLQQFGDWIAFRRQPKELRHEMLADAYKEALAERQKNRQRSTEENIEVSNRKMEIIRNPEFTNENKFRALSDLCYETGRTFTVATKRGAYMFEKEADAVRIKYAEKIYRTSEEKEKGIARYSFDNAIVGGIVYDKKGRHAKEDYGLFDAINRMSNEKDTFDESRRNLDAIIENGEEHIAEDNVPQVHLTQDQIQSTKLDQDIVSGNQQAIMDVVKKTLTQQENSYETNTIISEVAFDNACVIHSEPKTIDECLAEVANDIPENITGTEYRYDEPEL